MHSTSLRFNTAADLCSNCHQERNSQAGMPMNQVGLCTDCHMYNAPGISRVEGLAPTGHSFVLGSDACQRCHSKDIHAAHQVSTTDTPPVGTDKVIVTPVPTPAAPNAVAESNGGLSLPGVAGGALGGLLLGFVAAVVVRRNR
jgi:hypothetical protein